MEITVGQVSGAIAAAIFLAQQIFPNALILILVGILGNKHTAITWSVVQRQISSSLWPTILRSDTAAGNGVNIGVRLLALLRPLGMGLVAIAAVVTPLGLYDAIVPSSSMEAVPFMYLQDFGPMGSGTPPQNSSIGFTRQCALDAFTLAACPGTQNQINYDNNSYEIVGTYEMAVPKTSQELYESGLKDWPETVSSFFDIRGRQYAYRTDKDLQDGKIFVANTFRMLQSMLLNNAVEPVQGLIVDTISGGIGFRNHTVPLGIGAGAEWSEDLLWLEPVTECVNTNMSIEFTVGDGGSLQGNDLQNITLVDNGGFTNFIKEYPKLVMDDNQSNPKLRERAYKAAWLTNAYNMMILNVTRPAPGAFSYLNSHIGKRFPTDNFRTGSAANGIYTDHSFTSLLDPDDNTLSTVNNTYTNKTETTGLYANPFNITRSNFTDIQILCQGTGGMDYANSSNIFVQCGLFYGAAQRKDGVRSLIVEPNTTWVQPIYSCASLNKASIKSVDFKYNATLGSDLRSLTVTKVSSKVYEDESKMPLWGIEQPDPPMAILGLSQFWGLISEENAKASNLSTKRAAELYLAGYSGGVGLSTGVAGYEYVPGLSFPKDALSTVYDFSGGGTIGSFADYSGASNLNMFSLWQSLSKNETTIPRIMSLIWTDIMANAVQGTRGWGTSRANGGGLRKRDDNSSNGQTLVPVRVFNKRIKYHWLYAIPAFLALVVFSIVVLGAVCFAVIRNGPKRVRHYTQHLSAGRILAAEQYPGQSSKTAPTKLWTAQVGKRMINIIQGEGMQAQTAYSGAYPSAATPMMYGEKGDQAATTAVESDTTSTMNGKPHQGYMPVSNTVT